MNISYRDRKYNRKFGFMRYSYGLHVFGYVWVNYRLFESECTVQKIGKESESQRYTMECITQKIQQDGFLTTFQRNQVL